MIVYAKIINVSGYIVKTSEKFCFRIHIGIFVTVFINQEYCFGDYAGLTLGVFFVKKAKKFWLFRMLLVHLEKQTY